MHRANRLAEAKELYQRALGADPALAEALVGLGTLAGAVGATDFAVDKLARAVSLEPTVPEYRMHLSRALQDQGRLADAAEHLRVACRLRPGDAVLWESFGIALQSLGETAAAAEAYRRACAIAPDSGTRLKTATLISPIMASADAVAHERRQAESAIDALLADADLHIDDPLQAGLWPNFYLAFHGENNRELQRRYAALYLRSCPSLAFSAPVKPRQPGARVRVGLISKFFNNHSIGRTSRGLFARLSRDEFEVTAIFIAPVIDDEYSRFIRQHADRSLVVPQDLARARDAIAALELDILFYQDIGMEPFSYFLAFSRLAPVQCVSFGHPDTTGIPTIDYFISNNLYEPTDAESHYSERLFVLRELPTLAYYYRPQLPSTLKARADFGLPASAPLYICPQNLFKFHPDMDGLIERVLARDPDGRLVLVEGKTPSWTAAMRQRWQARMPELSARIIFVPRQNSADYLNLIAIADVMLDTLHFNGMNTSLEALAVGTPVVTLPGRLQRGRHTQAMYRAMGMHECIADDADHYADIAVGLGTDPGKRARLKAEILARNGVLFENDRVIDEFERFFRSAIAAANTPPGATP